MMCIDCTVTHRHLWFMLWCFTVSLLIMERGKWYQRAIKTQCPKPCGIWIWKQNFKKSSHQLNWLGNSVFLAKSGGTQTSDGWSTWLQICKPQNDSWINCINNWPTFCEKVTKVVRPALCLEPFLQVSIPISIYWLLCQLM